MSKIKNIISNIQEDNLVGAKSMIKSELLSRLGFMLEEQIEQIAPSMISEKSDKPEKEMKEKEGPKSAPPKKKPVDDEDQKSKKTMKKESFESEDVIEDEDNNPSNEFEAFVDQIHEIVQEIEEETGEELTEDEIIQLGKDYIELLNETDLPGNQERIDVAKPKGKITGADFKKLRSKGK